MKFSKIENNNADNEAREDVEDISSKPPSTIFSKKSWVVFLLFIGSIHAIALQTNMTIIVMEMISNKTLTIGNQTIHQPAEFNWDSRTVGLMMSVISYGLLGTPLGGYISSKFGGADTYGVSTLVVGLLSITAPMSLRLNFHLFLVNQLLVGLFESFAFASIADVFTHWTPVTERSTLMGYSFSGVFIGVGFVFPASGFIVHKWGWPMGFLLIGYISCAYSIIWLITVRNRPSKDPWISKRELNYLLRETENTARNEIVHPWRSILTSKCFWALCITKLAYGCGCSMLSISFPLYIKDTTGKATDEVGLFSGIPNIISIFTIPIAGRCVDYLQNEKNKKPTTIHKLILGIGFISASIFFILITFITNFTICMIGFVFINLFLAFHLYLTQLIGISMAPKHSSLIVGLIAVWFMAGMILTPTAVGYIVTNHRIEEWNACFIITSVILAIGAVVFTAYGSSEPQPWSTSSEDDKYNMSRIPDQENQFVKAQS